MPSHVEKQIQLPVCAEKYFSQSVAASVFLNRAASASGAVLLGRAYELHDAVDPRVAKVMAGTVSIDMHNHVYPAGTEPRPQHGPEVLIVEELKRSGLTAVCASYVLDFALTLRQPNKTYFLPVAGIGKLFLSVLA